MGTKSAEKAFVGVLGGKNRPKCCDLVLPFFLNFDPDKY